MGVVWGLKGPKQSLVHLLINSALFIFDVWEQFVLEIGAGLFADLFGVYSMAIHRLD
jgi:hypothetical protein